VETVTVLSAAVIVVKRFWRGGRISFRVGKHIVDVGSMLIEMRKGKNMGDGWSLLAIRGVWSIGSAGVIVGTKALSVGLI
jgi:hypothetical protein